MPSTERWIHIRTTLNTARTGSHELTLADLLLDQVLTSEILKGSSHVNLKPNEVSLTLIHTCTAFPDPITEWEYGQELLHWNVGRVSQNAGFASSCYVL